VPNCPRANPHNQLELILGRNPDRQSLLNIGHMLLTAIEIDMAQLTDYEPLELDATDEQIVQLP